MLLDVIFFLLFLYSCECLSLCVYPLVDKLSSFISSVLSEPSSLSVSSSSAPSSHFVSSSPNPSSPSSNINIDDYNAIVSILVNNFINDISWKIEFYVDRFIGFFLLSFELIKR